MRRALIVAVSAVFLALAAVAAAQRPAPSHLPRLDPSTWQPDPGTTVTHPDRSTTTTYRDGWTRTVERDDGGTRETYRDPAGTVQETVRRDVRGTVVFHSVRVVDAERKTTTVYEESYGADEIVRATRTVTREGRTIRYRWEPARNDWVAASLTDAVQLLVDAIYDRVFAFAAVLSAVGLVTMAFLQTVKDAFPVRRLFQRFWVRRWFVAQMEKTHRLGVISAASGPTELPGLPPEEDLLLLATGEDADAFYDLPIEQLCAQMNAAAAIVLDYPWRHERLLHALSAGASPPDIAALMAARPIAEKPRSEQTDEDRRRLSDTVDPRGRVGHQIQRNIDALQIAAGFRWKLVLQVISIALSGALVVVALWVFGTPPELANLWLYVLAAVLSGFLAPVARDLVAALQQLRK
jgi:hypothetical protein